MAGNRARAIPAPTVATVTSFTHDYRGVAHVDGKAVFIEGALAGETVEFEYTRVKRDFAEGRVRQVLTASSERVEPACAHFGVCGGCALQHLHGAAQIGVKQNVLLEQLTRIGKVEPETWWPPLTGPLWGYRHKARLAVKYVLKKGRAVVGFRERVTPYVADLHSCLVLHPRVGEHLTDLARLIESLSLRDRIPQIEVAVGEERCALVFRVLAEPSAGDVDKLREFARTFDYDLYLQTGAADTIRPLQREALPSLTYSLPAQGLVYEFAPTEFTQINVEINRRLVDRVLELLDLSPVDHVLDLFCGLGNFTLALAKYAGSAVGVEGDAALVGRARHNAARNHIDNATFYTADLSQPHDELPIAREQFNKILLDPARTGADGVVRRFPSWGARRVVYVSCNPSTLARDAAILVRECGYRLRGAGVLDMFPHTVHVESIALFER